MRTKHRRLSVSREDVLLDRAILAVYKAATDDILSLDLPLPLIVSLLRKRIEQINDMLNVD